MLSNTVHGSRALTPSRAFSALTVFSLLTQAVSMFIDAVLALVNAVACFERYQEFLVQEGTSKE